MKNTIILTGGGTAGHVWPHFALFEGQNAISLAFQEQKLEVHYVGSHAGMEKELVLSTQPNWHYHSIFTGKLRRYFNVQNFLDPLKIILGFIQSFFLVGKIKPSVVFSKGGFVSAPIVWAAWLRGVPVVIHESDATPALATKLTLPFSFKALVAFKETIAQMSPLFQKRVISIGLPVRESLFSASKEEAFQYFQFQSDKKVLLIFGGSLGAKSLNTKVFNMLDVLLENYQVIHITGKGNKKDVFSNHPNYRQYEFLKEDMKFAYAAADLALCRAGASSIFELAAARIPMILLPLGLHASRGDQIINAKIFANNGWAQWIDENSFNQDESLKIICSTIENLDKFKRNLSTAPSSESAKKIAEILWDIILRVDNVNNKNEFK